MADLATRFIFSDRHVFKKESRPKAGAFLPELHPDLQRYETSVCQRDGVDEDRLWLLGRTIRVDKQAVARADFQVTAALKAGLGYEPVPQENYPEHAVLIGWPTAVDDEKAKQKMLAELLASQAALCRPP